MLSFQKTISLLAMAFIWGTTQLSAKPAYSVLFPTKETAKIFDSVVFQARIEGEKSSIKDLYKHIFVMQKQIKDMRGNKYNNSLNKLIHLRINLSQKLVDRLSQRISYSGEGLFKKEWKKIEYQKRMALREINKLYVLTKKISPRNELVRKASFIYLSLGEYDRFVKKFNILKVKRIDRSDRKKLEFGRLIADLHINKNRSLESKVKAIYRKATYQTPMVQIFAHLKLAKFGNRTKSISQKRELLLASKICKTIPTKYRDVVFKESVAVWSRSSQFNGRWSQIPMNTGCFKNSHFMVGLAERVAHEHWQTGKVDHAFKLFSMAMDHKAGRKYVPKLLPHAYKIQARRFDEGRIDALQWQSYLMGVDKAYRHKLAVERDHNQLISRLIKKTNSKASKKKIEQLTIVFTKWSQARDFDDLSKKYYLQMADVFERADDYEQAKKMYEQVITSVDVKERKEHILAKSQFLARAAHWDLRRHWAKQKNGVIQYRSELLKTLYALDKINSNHIDWPLRSHIGALEIDLGRNLDGYSIWQKTIIDQPNHPFAKFALGQMMVSAKENKNWLWLEKLSYLAMQNSIEPQTGKNQAIDVDSLLELALYEDIKIKMAEENWSEAIKKLSTLTGTFYESNSYSHYLYMLATCEENTQQYLKAIETLKMALNLKNSTPYFLSSLNKAIDISRGMGDLNETLQYYQLFFKNFPNHKAYLEKQLEAFQIYSALNEIRGMESLVRNMDLDRVGSKNLSMIYTELFKVYKKKGEMDKALRLARKMISNPHTNPTSKAYVLYYMVDASFRIGDLKSIERLQRFIEKSNHDNLLVKEVKSYMKYVKSMMKLEDLTLLFKKNLLAGVGQAYQTLVDNLPRLKDDIVSNCHLEKPLYCVDGIERFESMINHSFDLVKNGSEEEVISESLKNNDKIAFIDGLRNELTEIKERVKAKGGHIPDYNAFFIKESDGEQYSYAGLGYTQWRE